MIIEKQHNGIHISEIINGVLEHCHYVFYTENEAIEDWKNTWHKEETND